MYHRLVDMGLGSMTSVAYALVVTRITGNVGLTLALLAQREANVLWVGARVESIKELIGRILGLVSNW